MLIDAPKQTIRYDKGDLQLKGNLSSLEGLFGERLNFRVKTIIVPMTGGASTVVATGAIPAGAKVLGLAARVIATISGASLTTWSLGDTDADLYAAGKGLTVGTTVSQADATADPSGTWSASARDLTFTAAAGVFSAGQVRLSIFYTDVRAAQR